MAIAAFKDLCLDAVAPNVLGPFWAAALGRTFEPADPARGSGARLVGPTPQHTIWINEVPEPKTVKHRMHFDIYASTLGELVELGARVLETQKGGRWTVMADPEGGEFCAFVRDEVPAERLHGLVVDCAEPRSIAHWWGEIFGALVDDDEEHGYSTVRDVAGMPILTMDFVPVPEPKTVKNRIHPDITVRDVSDLVAVGATVLRERGGDIGWTVMADPDGNEFCAFS
jgi:hypothetical protein